MKFKFTITAICCVFCFYQGFGQKQTVFFLKNSGEKVDKIEKADFFRAITGPDSGSTLYNVAEYYKDNKLKLISKTSNIDPLSFEGQCISYYPTGKKQEIANYHNGHKEGEYYKYYKNGKLYIHTIFEPKDQDNTVEVLMDCIDTAGKVVLKDGIGYYIGYDDDFKNVNEEGGIKAGLKNGQWKGTAKLGDDKLDFNEEYDAGKLITGKSVDAAGATYNYTQRNVQPQFKGGLGAFGQFLGSEIKYPGWARINRTQGKVLVAFVVGKDGSLGDFKIIQNPNDQMSEEAVRVLKMSPRWTPGLFYGKIARVSYTVPINFKLN
ncbi:energy transducer TonB [Mucilaginibacter sp. UR6-11]|uniref:energy transducer TonB n=1 Tax=Mucilaginibacter sp. UR6-11 TaxID=1435644 RepID=UPI001E28CF38|nr:energy transducer TonB [Mucilaginibacter sp. UR6-11]MCC8425585.1 TonB family protein [Mucilaginibacter sp. UR6-11]